MCKAFPLDGIELLTGILTPSPCSALVLITHNAYVVLIRQNKPRGEHHTSKPRNDAITGRNPWRTAQGPTLTQSLMSLDDPSPQLPAYLIAPGPIK